MNEIIEEACIRFVLCEMLEKNKDIEDTMRAIYFNLVGDCFEPFPNKPENRDIDNDTLIDQLRMSLAKRKEQRVEQIEDPVEDALEQPEHYWEIERQERMRKMKMDNWCKCCECNPCDCH